MEMLFTNLHENSKLIFFTVFVNRMNILRILNSNYTNINYFKFAKFAENPSSGSASVSKRKILSINNNIYNNERGTLSERDNALATELRTLIPDTLKLISSSKNRIKSDWFLYKGLIETPKDLLALKVNNPKVTVISAKIRNAGGEDYLDFAIHGYFGDKKRFLINKEGEIVKTPSENFFNDKKAHSYDMESLYYSQHEICNLGLNRYMEMFKSEIFKLKSALKYCKPVEKDSVPMTNSDVFSYNSKELFESVHSGFYKLYYGIMNNAKTIVQKKSLSDICGIKLNKNYPIILINNINDANQDVLINFIKLERQTAARIVVYDAEKQSKFLLLDGNLVEEGYKHSKTPLSVGKITKYYSSQESAELGIPVLLNTINERIQYGLKRLRAMLGNRIE